MNDIQYTVHFREGTNKPTRDIKADTYSLADGWFVFFRQAFTKEFGVVPTATYSFAQKDVDHIEAFFPDPVPTKPKLDLITN